MIRLTAVYALAGVFFAAFALLSAFDRTNRRRFGNAAFWALLALSFLAGDRMGDFGNGLLVLGLVTLAGAGALGRGNPPATSPDERLAEAQRRGNRLFFAALIIPATALAGTLLFRHVTIDGAPLVDPKQVTLVSLGLAIPGRDGVAVGTVSIAGPASRFTPERMKEVAPDLAATVTEIADLWPARHVMEFVSGNALKKYSNA
jgi:uncharacterized membrane protein